MNEEQILELDLAQDVTNLLINDFEAGYEALKEELEKSTKLESFFQNYQVDRWRVDNIQITDLAFQEGDTEGSIELECGISIYNGCSDLDKYDTYDDKVLFKIDLRNSIITIIGSPIPEPRTTHNEF